MDDNKTDSKKEIMRIISDNAARTMSQDSTSLGIKDIGYLAFVYDENHTSISCDNDDYKEVLKSVLIAAHFLINKLHDEKQRMDFVQISLAMLLLQSIIRGNDDNSNHPGSQSENAAKIAQDNVLKAFTAVLDAHEDLDESNEVGSIDVFAMVRSRDGVTISSTNSVTAEERLKMALMVGAFEIKHCQDAGVDVDSVIDQWGFDQFTGKKAQNNVH